MPIYEYRCPECGEIFEKFLRSATSSEPIRCPKCGSENPERLLSAFASGGYGGGSGAASSCGPSGFS